MCVPYADFGPTWPNILAERGIGEPWKHDWQGVINKSAVVAGLSVRTIAHRFRGGFEDMFGRRELGLADA